MFILGLAAKCTPPPSPHPPSSVMHHTQIHRHYSFLSLLEGRSCTAGVGGLQRWKLDHRTCNFAMMYGFVKAGCLPLALI